MNPEMIIPTAMVEKNAKINFFFMTFFNNKASGNERPIDPIINAMAVPNGTPLSTRDSRIGSTPTASMYKGIDIKTAMGTANGFDFDMYVSKKDCGT